MSVLSGAGLVERRSFRRVRITFGRQYYETVARSACTEKTIFNGRKVKKNDRLKKKKKTEGYRTRRDRSERARRWRDCDSATSRRSRRPRTSVGAPRLKIHHPVPTPICPLGRETSNYCILYKIFYRLII